MRHMLQRFLCLFGRHQIEHMIKRGSGTNRLCLECMDCGFETTGIRVGEL